MSYRKGNVIKNRAYMLVLGTALALGTSWAQSDSSQQQPGSSQQPADNTQQQGTGAVPAFGQDNAAPVSNDNPPLSGLDQPSLEPRAAARSFLIPVRMSVNHWTRMSAVAVPTSMESRALWEA